LAAENRRLGNVPLLERLETEVDDLHRAVEEQHSSALDQLQARKLSALAEFAAGAGHEINNPLAVISGQAQYLLRGEGDSSRQQALQTIIGQSQRIHETLRELMQFARPSRSQKQELDILSLVREVLTSLTELAADRRVRLVFPENHEAVHLHADPAHLRTALTCLLRNAIEAAGADGWAGVRLERIGPDQVDVVVEDSGSGPAWQQREHLFDPFYSGRPAGRGRGLGLPTAWRLAREQGGDVRFIGLPGGPTRFVLSLPHTNGTPKAQG
jgi:signal transduction histidine kinase